MPDPNDPDNKIDEGDDLALEEPSPPSAGDDAPPAPVSVDSHLSTAMPLSELRAQSEALSDIGVPGHLFGEHGRALKLPQDEHLPMESLKAQIFSNATPMEIRDQVWRYIIANAIEKRGQWYVFAIGVAADRLERYVNFMTRGGKNGSAADKRDVQHHLAAGFIAELYRKNDGEERIGDKMIWNAATRAKKAWWRNGEVAWPPLPHENPPEPDLPPLTKADMPSDVVMPYLLKSLVIRSADVKPSRTDRRPKLTGEDAALVALCVVYGRTIPEAAEELRMTFPSAKSAMPRIKQTIYLMLASRYRANRYPVDIGLTAKRKPLRDIRRK